VFIVADETAIRISGKGSFACARKAKEKRYIAFRAKGN
jgi:hypothetical protein